MKKYFSQLRPLERRLVVGVGVLMVAILNWWFIWPHFQDWTNYRVRLESAQIKLRNYTAMVDRLPSLKKEVGKYENEGEFVPLEDQGINFMSTIQNQSTESGVQLQTSSRPMTRTNDQFFVEQYQNINVLAPEANLVDFLYKLGSGSSMIRVRDLTLQPDAPRQKLAADIRLVASYQKSATASAAKNATAKAK